MHVATIDKDPTGMFDAIKSIAAASKELGLGVSGFFALIFMCLFVWGARRSIELTSGLTGEWRKLIDEGQRVRRALNAELNAARDALGEKDAEIEDLRRDRDELMRRVILLEAELLSLKRRYPDPEDAP